MLFDELIQQNKERMETYATLPFISAVRNGDISVDRYKSFLNDLYHIVWNFCPVMAAGASRCGDEYKEVRSALYEHIYEEKGHEEWVLNDCRAVGGGEFASAVKHGEARPEIQALCAYNYHVAEHKHGTLALAMVFTLELISQRLAGRVSAGVAKALNLEGDNGTTFLASHGPMDDRHLKEIGIAINTMDDPRLSEMMQNAVAVNFAMFAAMLS